jgi:uncharacterized membrane protein YraQ (UPF0718 family)
MLEAFLIFLLRATQTLLLALPTLMTGIVLASLLALVDPRSRLASLLNARRGVGMVLAWLLAVLAPVCSLGAIPILRQLRRTGTRPSSLMVFAIAAGMLTPLSATYLLDRLGPTMLVATLGISLMFSLCFAGLIVLGRFFPSRSLSALSRGATASPTTGSTSQVAAGASSLHAFAIDAGRRIDRPLVGCVLLAALINGLVATLLPAGSLEEAMEERGTEPLGLFSAVMLPTWIRPEQAAVLSAELNDGLMPALLFLPTILGSGCSVALLVAILLSLIRPARESSPELPAQYSHVHRATGTIGNESSFSSLPPEAELSKRLPAIRCVITILVAVAAPTLVLLASVAWADRATILSVSPQPEGSHAFDDLTRPYQGLTRSQLGTVPAFHRHLGAALKVENIACLVAILTLGIVARMRAGSLDRPSPADALSQALPSRRPLPTWARTSLVVSVIVASIYLLLRSFYASPELIFAESHRVNANLAPLVRRGASPATLSRYTDRLETLLDRLEPASYLRFHRPTERARRSLSLCRQAVEKLKVRPDHDTALDLSRLLRETERHW